MNEKELSRREFLQRMAAGTAAIGLAGAAGAAAAVTDAASTAALSATGTLTMPMRVLGKTGVKVSLLGIGGGSRFLAATEETCAEMLERAVAMGVTYFDTAAQYGKERASEKRFGVTLPKHRDKIFLATKSEDRTHDGMMKSVETSLKNLNTDKLDLVQMHAVGPKDTPENWEKPDGALTALRKLRDQKVIRFIGFTGHDKAETHKHVIESLEFDTVLMALNAAGHKAFKEIALPAAVEKKMGIIAMKVNKGLVGTGEGKATAAELLKWAWDLPITTVITGMETVAILEENIKTAGLYKPGSGDKSLAARIAPHATEEQVAWAMPGYEDRWLA